GLRQVLAIVDVPSNRDLDNALSGLPIIKEHGHSVELEILPIHPYEEYYEDMKKVLGKP
ncbi:MAG: MIase like protein, partial [Thaumarchaeota archaeon]|nr:MIase like protein [Nitrososphaerota archaeon]